MVDTRMGRRERSPEGRQRRIAGRYTEAEGAEVAAAAARHGLSPGAFSAAATLRAARAAESNPLDKQWTAVMRELMAQRRQVRNIGGLLNQLAAGFNSTGELDVSATAVLGAVHRIVDDLETLTSRARRRLR